MKIISVNNLKGGTGKTFVIKHIAHILATYNCKILVIDNDKQGNISDFFQAKTEVTLTDLMLGLKSIEEVIQKTKYKNIDIISADIRLMDTNIELLMNENRKQDSILAEALEYVKDQYHFCMIDNPPDINLPVFNALAVVNIAIIVTTPDKDSMKGLEEMMQQMEIAQKYNPTLSVYCLLNKFFSSEICYGWKRREYPFFNTNIHLATRNSITALAKSIDMKIPVNELSPGCQVSRDLKNLVKELLHTI